MFAKEIEELKSINCLNATSVDLFKKKYQLFHNLLSRIEVSALKEEILKEVLNEALSLIIIWGHEIAYNRSFEFKGNEYYKELIFAILRIAKSTSNDSDKWLTPFYKQAIQVEFDPIIKNALINEANKLTGHGRSS